MGCCSSRPQLQYAWDAPRGVSTTDVRALGGKDVQGGCKLWPYVACCPASYPYRAFTRVVEKDTHIFAALFSGVGGHQAAQHCISTCYEVLMQQLPQCEPDRALRNTVHQLESSFFDLPNLPDQVKALVGAVGTMLYLHTGSNQVYIANIGNPSPFLTRSTGSFSDITVEAQLLTSDARHRHPLSWHHEAVLGDVGASPSAAAAADAAAGGQSEARCIGMGYGKRAVLSAAWVKALGHRPAGLPKLPFIRTDCEVTVSPLSPSDEALVLASADMAAMVAPRELATLVHYFGRQTMATLQDTYLPNSVTVALPQEAMSMGDPSPQAGVNTIHAGSVAVHHARGKALSRYNTRHTARLSHDQLQALTLEVAAAPGQDLAPPEEGPGAAPGSKRTLHGDMAAIIICLQWPRAGGRFDSSTSSHHLVAKLARSPRAAYRWQLVRQLVRFQVARRRQLLRSWWEAAERLRQLREAETRAQEVAAWRQQGAAVQMARPSQQGSPWHGKYTSSSPHKSPPTAKLAGSAATATGRQAALGSASASSSKPHSQHGLRRSTTGQEGGRGDSTPTRPAGGSKAGLAGSSTPQAMQSEPATPVLAAATYSGVAQARDVQLLEVAASGDVSTALRDPEGTAAGAAGRANARAVMADASPDASKARLRDAAGPKAPQAPASRANSSSGGPKRSGAAAAAGAAAGAGMAASSTKMASSESPARSGAMRSGSASKGSAGVPPRAGSPNRNRGVSLRRH